MDKNSAENHFIKDLPPYISNETVNLFGDSFSSLTDCKAGSGFDDVTENRLEINNPFTSDKYFAGDIVEHLQHLSLNSDFVYKDSRIVTCADILVIQLKRFQLSNGHVSKDTRIVSCYPDVLKIPVHADDNITLNQQYSLVATINHSGNLQSGHYWANIKPHSSHEWLSCNDNRVAPINVESVNNATS